MNNAEVLMETNTAEQRISFGKLAWGLVLLFVGGYAFVEAIDLWSARELWRLWPVALIVIGAANEFDALRARRSDGSYMVLAVGLWMLAGTQRWFDFSVRSAFPIGVIVAGVFVCIHALIDKPEPKKLANANASARKENDR